MAGSLLQRYPKSCALPSLLNPSSTNFPLRDLSHGAETRKAAVKFGRGARVPIALGGVPHHCPPSQRRCAAK